MTRTIQQIDKEMDNLREERQKLENENLSKYQKEIDRLKREVDDIITQHIDPIKGKETITLEVHYELDINTDEIEYGEKPHIEQIYIDRVVDKSRPKSMMSKVIRSWILNEEVPVYMTDTELSTKDHKIATESIRTRFEEFQKKVKKLPMSVQGKIWEGY
jgi:hypothetical protein